MDIGLVHYLTVGAVLFGLGLLTVMTRKNAVGILLGVELILNASEAAIALAIVLQVYRNYRSIMADRLIALKN